MFLFAKLVMENLLDQTSQNNLMKELEPDTFPVDLKNALVTMPTRDGRFFLLMNSLILATNALLQRYIKTLRNEQLLQESSNG